MIVAILTVLTLACGGDGLRSVSEVRLQVEVLADDEGALETGLVICDGARGRGTGLYEDEDAAGRACDTIRRNLGVQRILFGAPDGARACPEIYGGPQRAKIAGVVDGDEIDVRIDRADGCGIADWTTLEQLIGPPPAPPSAEPS